MAIPLRIVLVGTTGEELEALRARAEAHDHLTVVATITTADLDAGVAVAAADAVWVSPAAWRRWQRLPGGAALETAIEPLTARERDVLAMAADGLSNREIATALEISDHTVKFHLASIFGKLGVSSRTMAVRRGLQLGLIDI